MKKTKKLNVKRKRRAARVGAKLSGTAARPRLVVNRTNRYLYAQLIDDAKGYTLAAVSTLAKEVGQKKTAKTAQSFAAGEALAKKAAAKGITAAVFDRRASKFHGRVKGFADGAKKGGLKI